MTTTLNVEQRHCKLARRFSYLPPGRCFAVAAKRPTGLDWTIKQTGNGKCPPSRLTERAIENALARLRLGREGW